MDIEEKKNNKTWILFIIIGFIILAGAAYVIYAKFQDRKEEIKTLEKEITELRKDQSNVVNPSGNEEIVYKSCTFTKTFNIVNLIDYITDTGPVKYIVVDAYQDKNPILLKVHDNTLALELGKTYEITFSSNTKYADTVAKGTITNIVPTDKVGMDQTQETCK